MKNIGILPNIHKDQDLAVTKLLVEAIEARGRNPVLTGDVSKFASDRPEIIRGEEDFFSGSDMIIALGGDGTFLNAARKTIYHNIPILGINLGKLGFLTEVEVHDIDEALDRVFKGEYHIEDRMLLEAEVTSGGRSVGVYQALNDVVIRTGALSRLISLDVYVNDMFVDNMNGDGIIVSTPTGSTAYSLSAGGPIVEPELNAMILTPICTHTLHSRPFVIDKRKTIRIAVMDNNNYDAAITIDGQQGYKIHEGDIVEVRKHEHSVKVMKLRSKSFYDILRDKLYCRRERD